MFGKLIVRNEYIGRDVKFLKIVFLSEERPTLREFRRLRVRKRRSLVEMEMDGKFRPIENFFFFFQLLIRSLYFITIIILNNKDLKWLLFSIEQIIFMDNIKIKQ